MLKIGAQMCLKVASFRNFVKLPVVSVCKTENLVLTNLQFVRNTSFFNRLTQQQLWKGVTSVSNAGKRKGRGRRRNLTGKRNLSEGQKLGMGRANMVWPGLNAPLFDTKEFSETKINKKISPQTMPEVSTNVKISRKRAKMNPLERGWSGRKLKGKLIDPPESENSESFEGFQSIILEHKSRSVMSSILGRKRVFFGIVATGNRNGVIGVGAAHRENSTACVNLAKKKSSKRLLTIDLIENHTVNHDFFCKYGKTKIFVYKKSKGQGLYCHRVIKALCNLIGIENLTAKIEGPCNVIHIIRAFITGLRRQKTYQEIANEMKLHLVEFREESQNFPRVLASPEKSLSLEEKNKCNILFEEYIMGGRLVYNPGPKVPFFQKLPSWETHLKRTLYCRNHDKVRIDLLAEYDSCKSHLSDVYPECRCTLSITPPKPSDDNPE